MTTGAGMDRNAEMLAGLARLEERTEHLQRTDERLVHRISTLEQRVDASAQAVTQQGWQLSQALSQLQTLTGGVTSIQARLQQQEGLVRAAKVVVGLVLIAAALLGQVQGADRIGRALLGLP